MVEDWRDKHQSDFFDEWEDDIAVEPDDYHGEAVIGYAFLSIGIVVFALVICWICGVL